MSLLKISPRWTSEQLKLAFYLYCQLPFGKLHQGTAEIIELASLIGRTPSALAMKLCNFASLDPAITASGRRGLDGASKRDREVWAAFHADWEGLAEESERLRQALRQTHTKTKETTMPANYAGDARVVASSQRIKQHFFRRMVLSSYRSRCCMSRVSHRRLLVASHIVPWRTDVQNRLNPSNGLCLSALHDRAFDAGLISVSDDLRVIVSAELRTSRDEFTRNVFASLDGCKIEAPERFSPSREFLAHHRSTIFIDQ